MKKISGKKIFWQSFNNHFTTTILPRLRYTILTPRLPDQYLPLWVKFCPITENYTAFEKTHLNALKTVFWLRL